jgi:hypothetical protein
MSEMMDDLYDEIQRLVDKSLGKAYTGNSNLALGEWMFLKKNFYQFFFTGKEIDALRNYLDPEMVQEIVQQSGLSGREMIDFENKLSC